MDINEINQEYAYRKIDPYFLNPYTAVQRKKIIGDRLVELRTNYHLTQKTVCEIIGVTPQTYSGYEKGKYEANAETLVRISYLFNTTVDYLVARNSNDNDHMADMVQQANTYDQSNQDNVYQRLIELELELNSLKAHFQPTDK